MRAESGQTPRAFSWPTAHELRTHYSDAAMLRAQFIKGVVLKSRGSRGKGGLALSLSDCLRLYEFLNYRRARIQTSVPSSVSSNAKPNFSRRWTVLAKFIAPFSNS